MKIIKLKEADNTKIFTAADKISDERIKQRKIRLARVAKEALAAATVAERNGNTDVANTLRAKAQMLTDLAAGQAETSDNTKSTENATINAPDETGNIENDADNKDLDDENQDQNQEDSKANQQDDQKSEQDLQDEKDAAEIDKSIDDSNITDNSSIKSIDLNNKNASDNSKNSNTDDTKATSNTDEDSDNNDNSEDKEASNDEDDETDINDIDVDKYKNKNQDPSDQDPSEDSNKSKKSTNKDKDSDDDDDDGNDSSDDDGDDNEITDDEEHEEDDTKIDPFKKTIGNGQKNSKKTETVPDALKRIFSTLKGDAKKGAIDALKRINKEVYRNTAFNDGTNESLQESLKSVKDMSDDEFADLINSTLAEIDKVKKVNYSADLNARVKQIKADMSNVIKNRELSTEDNNNTFDERRKTIQTLKADNVFNNRKKKSFPGINIFKINFFRAIKNQVDMVEDEDDSWSAINKKFEDEKSLMVKGQLIDDKFDEAIPLIDVYFDQSGSFGQADIDAGMAALNVIQEFEDRGEIKINYYFFSNNVFTRPQPARAQGGTGAWEEILANIKDHKAKNVVIITDSDMGSMASMSDGLLIDGCVYYLWRNGEYAESIPQKLNGREGTFQYTIEVWDKYNY